LTRLVHVVADYGPGDLAFAELLQRLELALGDVAVQPTRVASGDTLSAGFCVAQLALTPGPAGRVVVHDVAHADGHGDRLCAARTPDGVLIVGRAAGWCWSFVVDAVRCIWALEVAAPAWPPDPPEALPQAVVRVIAGHSHAVRDRMPRVAVPPYPTRSVAYVDGYGKLKTTITGLPAPRGSRVLISIGEVSAPATVADAAAAAAAAAAPGELALAPISPAWRTRLDAERSLLELTVRGGSAAQRFGDPRPGAPISLLAIEPPPHASVRAAVEAERAAGRMAVRR
jgi:hypothetical protein